MTINQQNYPTGQAQISKALLFHKIQTILNTKQTETNMNNEVIQNLKNYSKKVEEIYNRKNDKIFNLSTDY